MGFLTDLRRMDFLEQFQILNEIETDRRFEAIPELFEYYVNPLGDKAVDYVIKTTLAKLLAQDEKGVLAGLDSPHEPVRKLCVRLAGEARFVSCAVRLLEMEAETQDVEFLYEVLEALSRLALPEFLPVFRRQVANPESLISALALDMIAQYKDAETIPVLKEIVVQAESDEGYAVCDWPTWKAIEALATIATPDALNFLATKLHHRNPTARRIIHENLIKIGAPAISYIALRLKTGTDDAIMAANVIGFLGDRKGADPLIEALGQSVAKQANVRFAIYEALGRISSMKSAVALADGLSEAEPLVLMAVMTGIERQMNPGVIKKIKELIAADSTHGAEICAAVIAAKAVTVFVFLYSDENLGTRLIELLRASGDAEAVAMFKEKLAMMDSSRAKADLASLETAGQAGAGPKILAVDDSEAMLNFYRNVIASWGCILTTAANGREALDMIEMGYPFDLVVADMNMPVMDGVELTRKIKECPTTAGLPVIMITTETEGSQAELARKAGVDAFMKKPFKPHELKERIAGFLPELA